MSVARSNKSACFPAHIEPCVSVTGSSVLQDFTGGEGTDLDDVPLLVLPFSSLIVLRLHPLANYMRSMRSRVLGPSAGLHQSFNGFYLVGKEASPVVLG